MRLQEQSFLVIITLHDINYDRVGRDFGLCARLNCVVMLSMFIFFVCLQTLLGLIRVIDAVPLGNNDDGGSLLIYPVSEVVSLPILPLNATTPMLVTPLLSL